MIPPDLPDPETMSREDLVAEVLGGREAYAVLVEELKAKRKELADLRRNLDGERHLARRFASRLRELGVGLE